jgi:hypothetical protein
MSLVPRGFVMRAIRAAVGIVVLLCIVEVFGCSPSSRAIVEGVVTLDGEPVGSGAIAFRPLDGKAPTTGAFITRGKFSQQVPVGAMRAEITSPRNAGKRKVPSYNGTPIEIEITMEGIPEQYNTKSGLVIDVKPGVNRVTWDLKSQP